MMTLSTVPMLTDALNNINVHWSTGLKNHGIVSVKFSCESSDQALIASNLHNCIDILTALKRR